MAINIILYCCIAVSLIIGTPSIIYGCDSYYPYCITQNTAHKTILQTKQIVTYLRSCSLQRNYFCINYTYYTYWKNNIIFNDCIYYANNIFQSNDAAKKYADINFSNGTSMFIVQNNNNCSMLNNFPKHLAICGIFFLSLALLLIMVIIYLNFNFITNKIKRRNILYIPILPTIYPKTKLEYINLPLLQNDYFGNSLDSLYAINTE